MLAQHLTLARSVAPAIFCLAVTSALVLTALKVSQVSYVGPFRELAIGIGVLLGALILKEHVTRGRAAGAGSVALGAITIALAP